MKAKELTAEMLFEMFRDFDASSNNPGTQILTVTWPSGRQYCVVELKALRRVGERAKLRRQRAPAAKTERLILAIHAAIEARKLSLDKAIADVRRQYPEFAHNEPTTCRTLWRRHKAKIPDILLRLRNGPTG